MNLHLKMLIDEMAEDNKERWENEEKRQEWTLEVKGYFLCPPPEMKGDILFFGPDSIDISINIGSTLCYLQKISAPVNQFFPNNWDMLYS